MNFGCDSGGKAKDSDASRGLLWGQGLEVTASTSGSIKTKPTALLNDLRPCLGQGTEGNGLLHLPVKLPPASTTHPSLPLTSTTHRQPWWPWWPRGSWLHASPLPACRRRDGVPQGGGRVLRVTCSHPHPRGTFGCSRLTCRWGQLGDSVGRDGTAGFGGWEAALGIRSTLLLLRGDVLLLGVGGVLLLGCSLRFGWWLWGDKAPSGTGHCARAREKGRKVKQTHWSYQWPVVRSCRALACQGR